MEQHAICIVDIWRAHDKYRVGTCQIHGGHMINTGLEHARYMEGTQGWNMPDTWGHMIDTGLEHARYMDNSEYMVDT